VIAGVKLEAIAVVRKVASYFTTNHALKSPATFSGLTPNYLCKAFKRFSGKTVFEYLTHRHIQDAMLRFRSSKGKITTIAFDCGFNDLSYFNRTFCLLTGSTLTIYRHH
jgi:AraC-like DNA-binding protein